MGDVLEFHYHFPSRDPRPLGPGLLARIADWWTRMWWRFDLAVLIVVMWVMMMITPEPADKLTATVAVLVCAPLILPVLKVLLLFTAWIPFLGRMVAYGRYFYFVIFSRLIVEKAPMVSLPGWFSGGRR